MTLTFQISMILTLIAMTVIRLIRRRYYSRKKLLKDILSESAWILIAAILFELVSTFIVLFTGRLTWDV
jgi:hypothetical protein